MLDLGSAEKEQRAAFIVRQARHVPYLHPFINDFQFGSEMNVSWSYGQIP
jgi:hypothetical protein